MADPWIVSGRVASVIHAHPLQGERAEDAVYLDPDEGGQLVAYVRGEKPAEGRWVRVSGKPFEFDALPKRGAKPLRVRQLHASSWEPLRERERVEEALRRLTPELSSDDRQRAQIEIHELGWHAFPVLIAHWKDNRVYEKGRDVQNYMGLPALGPRPEPIYADVTIGNFCSDLLHRLLIPKYRSPHERVFKPRGEMFVVRDWPAWWRKHHRKGLAEFHRELEPRVDRYFQSGGDPQVIDESPGGLAALLKQDVTLEGTAVDQKLGAVLLTEQGEVWIDGLDSWPAGYHKGGRDGKRLRVKGRLIEREDLPVFEAPGPGKPQKGGIPVPKGGDLREAARRYVLTNGSWEPID